MFLSEMRKFVSSFVAVRYKSHFTTKLPANIFRGDLECSYLGGSLTICEEVFKRNRASSYLTKDDVIADLHLLYLECFNEFQSKYGFKVADKATLDKPIKLSKKTNE